MQLAKSKIGRWTRCRTNAHAVRVLGDGQRGHGQLSQFGWPETTKMGGVGRHGVIEGISGGQSGKDRVYVVRPYDKDGNKLSYTVEMEAKKLVSIS